MVVAFVVGTIGAAALVIGTALARVGFDGLGVAVALLTGCVLGIVLRIAATDDEPRRRQ